MIILKNKIDNSSANTARERMIQRQTNPAEKKKFVDKMLGNKAQKYRDEIERLGPKAKFYEKELKK